MKILLIADIHANWPALSAIRERFDICLFAGDLVDYATDPSPCIDWIRQESAVGVRGNHDHALAQRVSTRRQSGLPLLASATRTLHLEQLDRTQVKFLSRLPVTRRFEIAGMKFFLVHATPRDPLDEYLAADPQAWASRVEAVDADIICVGHTHQQFLVDLGRKRVVNPGSVGQPRDGDPRCAYAIIEDGHIEFRRVEYDIQATVDQMRRSGLQPTLIELSEHVLRSGGHVDPAVQERLNGLNGLAGVD